MEVEIQPKTQISGGEHWRNIDADIDRDHFCNSEFRAQTWLFDSPRPVHCWFDNTGISGAG